MLFRSPKSAVLFYYAGHAIQLKGENYLVPTEARLRTQADILRETVSLHYIMTQLSQAKHYLNVVMLDACRNNPWPDSLSSAANGLAPITAIPRNTVVLYATAANDFSSDGEGRNGILTKNLLAAIRIPGLTVDDMFKRISDGVQGDSLAAVGHAQTPALYTNFTGEFCFAGCIDKVARAELEKMQQADREQLDKARQEKEVLEARNRDMEAKLAASQTSLNCDKAVLSDYGQCFAASPEATRRAVSEALLQRGFTIDQSSAENGEISATRSVQNSKNKNATDQMTATATVRAVPVTGHSVVTIAATQRIVAHEESQNWSQIVVIPIPTSKSYADVVKSTVNVTDPAFYHDLFATIELNLRSAGVAGTTAPPAATEQKADVAPNAASETVATDVPAPASSVASTADAGTRSGTGPSNPPKTAGDAQHFAAPLQRTFGAVIATLVRDGYIIESADETLQLVTAFRKLRDPRDVRYSTNIVLSATVMAEPTNSGARVRLMASQKKLMHNKPSKPPRVSRSFFGGISMLPMTPGNTSEPVVKAEGSITDAAFYIHLYTAVETELQGGDTPTTGRARRFNAPATQTLHAVLDGLAQLGYDINHSDAQWSYVTATRGERDPKETEIFNSTSVTAYVSAGAAGDSRVLFAASEQRLADGFVQWMGESSTVVVQEGEVSDALFYQKLFDMVDRKLAAGFAQAPAQDVRPPANQP